MDSESAARGSSNRQLENAGIRQAIEALRQSETSTANMSRQQRQEWWTSLVRDESLPVADRLRASELLGKSQDDFLQRVEHTGTVDIVKIIEERRAARIKSSME